MLNAPLEIFEQLEGLGQIINPDIASVDHTGNQRLVPWETLSYRG